MIIKRYPYLQEQFKNYLNAEQQRRQFLTQLDDDVNQKQYILITLLDWNENPIKEIQGEITGGSLSVDGASSVRRTGNLSCTISANTYNMDSLNMDFSLNKKIFLEIGIKNKTTKYQDSSDPQNYWPILWFPQGIFLITDFSLNSSSSSSLNLSITIKDKMCLLNGDVGGRLPAFTQFDVMDTQLSNGQEQEQKVLIHEIILELVNHFGGEQISNIIIQDIPLRIKQVVKWNGNITLWGKKDSSAAEEKFSWIFSLENHSADKDWIGYEPGVDVGYVYRDFVYSGELTGNAGTPITTILDEIKNSLGNYEYFYDVFGVFHFREIKNYLNITQAQIVEEDMKNPGRVIKFLGGNFLLDEQSENQYLIETTNSKSIYSFNDDANITSITVTPQYGNIKNDYIIEGIKQGTTSDVKKTIRYRLAIDDKPEKKVSTIGGKTIEYYMDSYDNIAYYYDEKTGEHKLAVAELVQTLPSVGIANKVYYTNKVNENNISVKKGYMWQSDKYVELYCLDEKQNHIPIIVQTYYPKDWRTALYISGLVAESKGLDRGKYFEDLEAFWPSEYDLHPDRQCFFGEKGIYNSSGALIYSTITHDLTNGTFFLDFIDANSSQLGMYSVNAIGRREDVISNDKINCLFVPEIPDIIFLNTTDPSQNWTENTAGNITEEQLNSHFSEVFNLNGEEYTRETKMLFLQRKECENNNQPWAQVNQDIYGNLSIGGYSNSAYEALRYELFCHTRYQKSVALTSIPIFYLDVNSRVELSSKSTGTYGDFMVQNISFSFGPGANMSVTLNETAERL